jgi:DNA-binding NtrC family response regulator
VVPKRILVIDADALVLYGLEKALKSEGVEVATAGTAAEAVVKLSACGYDLCLLDVHLSDYGGIELMKIIKDICPKVRVIVMTCNYIDDPGLGRNINEAIRNATCHFVSKPFNLSELKEIVAQALHSDNGFHTGFRFRDDRYFERKIRKIARKPFVEEIRFSMSVIDNGEEVRRGRLAQAVDLTTNGLGLLTDFPLLSSQIVTFEHKALVRTGVVIWSTMLDERTCRAGVQFA